VKARRRARAVALQTLYEVDLAGHPASDVMKQRLADCDLDDEHVEFVDHLVRGVLGNLSEIDAHVREIAPEWPLEQMSPVDKNILRIAIFEMTYDPEIPVKVAINEAVELAKLFGSESSRRFVNGALGTLAAQQLMQQTEGERK
jgi:N utilization substance protein B